MVGGLSPMEDEALTRREESVEANSCINGWKLAAWMDVHGLGWASPQLLAIH